MWKWSKIKWDDKLHCLDPAALVEFVETSSYECLVVFEVYSPFGKPYIWNVAESIEIAIFLGLIIIQMCIDHQFA